MSRLLLVDHHDQVLDVWRAEGRKALAVAHLDAHCDMRGLVVDSARRAAALLGPSVQRPSTFLAVAAAEGIVHQVRWAHDAHGGRGRDTFTFLYEEDLAFWPFRRLRRRWQASAKFPFALSVLPLAEYRPRPDEVLDVDWDLFFLAGKPRAEGDADVEAFLSTPGLDVVREACVSRSPEYLAADAPSPERFAERLAERMGARVERVSLRGRRPARAAGWARRAASAWMPRARNALIALQGGRFR